MLNIYLVQRVVFKITFTKEKLCNSSAYPFFLCLTRKKLESKHIKATLKAIPRNGNHWSEIHILTAFLYFHSLVLFELRNLITWITAALKIPHIIFIAEAWTILKRKISFHLFWWTFLEPQIYKRNPYNHFLFFLVKSNNASSNISW